MREEFPRACPAPPDDASEATESSARPLSPEAEELIWIAERAGLDGGALDELRRAMTDWSRRFSIRSLEGHPRPDTEEAGLVALTVERVRRFLRG
ncbi:MAG: hypothetical protein ABI592_15195 [Acidobacteriota bacterium]